MKNFTVQRGFKYTAANYLAQLKEAALWEQKVFNIIQDMGLEGFTVHDVICFPKEVPKKTIQEFQRRVKEIKL